MHRLGEHMIGEMRILGAQADAATAKGLPDVASKIRGTMDEVGRVLSMGEHVRTNPNAPLVNEH